jgi:PAS domain S-box-containing protein
MSDAGVDIAALERQLAELSIPEGAATELLMRLAEVIFPGRVGVGDRSRILWPEPGRERAWRDADGEHLDARERLLAQIRRSEDRFRSLVEQLPAVVFFAALGEEDNEVYVSPQIESLLGFTQQEWLTNPLLWYSQLHPDDHDIVIDAFTRGVQTGGPFRAQVRFFARDGSEVWIMGEAKLILDDAQRPAYFQGVAFDVTLSKRAQEVMAQAERSKAEAAQLRADAFAARNVELTRLNEQLRVAKEQAEAAALARSTFLTTMSHELRTPLNSVVVLAGLLADGELSSTQHDMVRRMRLSSDHLLELINDVLEFSRLRAGQVELDRHTFDLETWLSDTVDIIAPRASEKGLDVLVAVAADVPRTLTTDAGRLRQVLLNLLANAVKFTSSGHIDVSITAQALERAATLSRAAPTDLAGSGPQRWRMWEFQCVVSDTGVGINPEAVATLFDEFRQADSGISREFGGTGLGLAICKRLCELLDGRIWAEFAPVAGQGDRGSSPGSGATFTFTWVAEADDSSRPVDGQATHLQLAGPRPAWGPGLPPGTAAGGTGGNRKHGPFGRSLRRLRPGRGREGNGAAPPAHGDALRVLLVEDDMMNREVAILLLGSMGHHADVVSSGAEAIDAVSARSYDAVLMDVAMPSMDGLSTTRAIRRLGGTVHQPYVVALTANALPGDAEVCLAAGMDDYVAKPIRRGELSRALAAAAAPGPRRMALPDVAPSPVTSEFDSAVLNRILAEFGPDPLQRLMAIFRSQAPRLANDASVALAAGDADATYRAAHTLKSSAANIGAVGLATASAQLETLAREGSVDFAQLELAALNAGLAGALDHLATFEAGLPR